MTGSSPATALLLHGLPDTGALYDPLVPLLEEAGVAAVAPDLPGFGSEPPLPSYSVMAYATWLEERRTADGLGRVHLVMHDIGGAVGLVWALLHPEACVSVTLVNCGLMPGYRWHWVARVCRTPIVGGAFSAVSRGRVPRAMVEFYRALDAPGVGAEMAAALFAPRDIPALVLWGERDPFLPVAYAARQRDAFPSAQVRTIPGAGHWPMRDAPAAVWPPIAEFVKSNMH